jgi:ABC-2 type transport system ATP-binding protein
VGVVDRGRLVLQDDLELLRGPTGRVLVRTPDVGQAAAVLDGRVAERDEDRLVIDDADVALVNKELVAAGLRVTEIGPERRTLEDLVLSVTGAGSDRFGRTTAPATGGFTAVVTDGSAAAPDAEAGGSSR